MDVALIKDEHIIIVAELFIVGEGREIKIRELFPVLWWQNTGLSFFACISRWIKESMQSNKNTCTHKQTNKKIHSKIQQLFIVHH